MSIDKETKTQLIEEFARHDGDTGSVGDSKTLVQVRDHHRSAALRDWSSADDPCQKLLE